MVDPITPYRGRFSEKIEMASSSDHDSKQLLFNNAFQNFCRFRDIRGQRFPFLTPNSPYYVRHDQDLDMIILRMSRARFLFLTLISNY